MKIGIIGCGAIAREIAEHRSDVVALYDVLSEKCSEFSGCVCNSLDELIEKSDFVIEAASPDAVRQYAMKIVERGRDLLIMSVGGLVDSDFRKALLDKCKEKNVRIYIPSGAIGGLDLIASAKIAGIEYAKITSIKNCKTLGVNCKERTLVFHGTAAEAIKRFPKSTNVTVLLTIATGVDVEVEVYADPEIKENTHIIHIKGTFGEAKIEVRNKPSELNPKTSYLAAISPLAILNAMDSPVKIGV